MLDTRAYLHFDMNVYVCVSLLLAWQIIALIQFTDKFYLNSFRCCCCACCSFLSLPAPAHSSCLSFSVQSLQHIASVEHQPASQPASHYFLSQFLRHCIFWAIFLLLHLLTNLQTYICVYVAVIVVCFMSHQVVMRQRSLLSKTHTQTNIHM